MSKNKVTTLFLNACVKTLKSHIFSQLILDHLVQHTIHFPINYHKLLLQAIQENPQQFINLLGEGGGGGAEPPTGGAAPPPPAATVHITPEEKAAIDRVRICRLVYFVT